MAEVRDVQNIVEVVKFVAAASGAYDAAKADGKLDVSDLVNVLPVIPYFEPAVKDIRDVVPEFEDMSSEELALVMLELQKVGFIGKEVELANQIRVSLEALRSLYKAYAVFAKKPAVA